MNKQNIATYFSEIIKMPVSDAMLLTEIFEPIEFNKNELLFKEGKASAYTYILEEGFVRSFTNDVEGNEVTTNLFGPITFVNDFMAFFKQQPVSENFQTLASCMLWKASYANIQNSFHSNPQFREMGRMLLLTNYSKLHQRMLGLIKDTAETRYLNLIEQQPTIFQNVSLKIIASYLGIKDSSLSRIRKELMSK